MSKNIFKTTSVCVYMTIFVFELVYPCSCMCILRLGDKSEYALYLSVPHHIIKLDA